MRKVNTTIKYIEPYSIAEDAGIEVGDKLISINGHDFHDILEYRYLTAEYEVTLEILKKDGTTAVSYTHLDVYKRQPLICAGTPSS